jgi:16S rRNA (adenine1518-N6/adenine1519-N6)-dimethyltransferase
VRVVANLPFYISTAIIQALMKHSSDLFDITLMLQREVVERITSQPGGREYGYLTVLVKYHCEAIELFQVAPAAFSPVPKVWSAVMRLRPHTIPPATVSDESRFFSMVRSAFAHRRKTILNNLKAWSNCPGERPPILAALGRCSIDPRRRAETLTIAEFVALHEAITAKKR